MCLLIEWLLRKETYKKYRTKSIISKRNDKTLFAMHMYYNSIVKWPLTSFATHITIQSTALPKHYALNLSSDFCLHFIMRLWMWRQRKSQTNQKLWPFGSKEFTWTWAVLKEGVEIIGNSRNFIEAHLFWLLALRNICINHNVISNRSICLMNIIFFSFVFHSEIFVIWRNKYFVSISVCLRSRPFFSLWL